MWVFFAYVNFCSNKIVSGLKKNIYTQYEKGKKKGKWPAVNVVFDICLLFSRWNRYFRFNIQYIKQSHSINTSIPREWKISIHDATDSGFILISNISHLKLEFLCIILQNKNKQTNFKPGKKKSFQNKKIQNFQSSTKVETKKFYLSFNCPHFKFQNKNYF